MSIEHNQLESYRGKTVVLAGGRGYLGAQVANSLSEVPCNIIFIDHSPWNDWVPRAKLAHYSHIQGDLRDPDVWDKALPGADVVFLLASIERTFMRDGYNLLADYDSSPKMAIALIEKYRDKKSTVPVVYCSSTNIYGIMFPTSFNSGVQVFVIICRAMPMGIYLVQYQGMLLLEVIFQWKGV